MSLGALTREQRGILLTGIDTVVDEHLGSDIKPSELRSRIKGTVTRLYSDLAGGQAFFMSSLRLMIRKEGQFPG